MNFFRSKAGNALFAMLLSSTPLLAATYTCAGNTPDWTLELTSETAVFDWTSVVEFGVPQQTTSPGREWPKALTLLGGRDTAIVILNEKRCSTAEITAYPFTAHILTQKGETPVILTGCCTRN